MTLKEDTKIKITEIAPKQYHSIFIKQIHTQLSFFKENTF